MPAIIDFLKQYFTEHDLEFTQMEDPSLLQLVYAGEKAAWTCYARALEEREQFVFYSIFPLEAPDIFYAEVAELLTRINYQLTIGSFDMDFEDGQVRCKTGISVANAKLDKALIHAVVFSNLTIMERYLDGITAVMSGYLSPTEAMNDVALSD